MVKKYKIILFICFVVLLCNSAAKIYLTNEQSKTILKLQEKVSVARKGKDVKPGLLNQKKITDQDKLEMILKKIPEEFSLTRYADGIRSLIDKNNLYIENSLIFKPDQMSRSDLLMLKYTTDMIVIGNYIQIKELLADIQNLPGISFFNSVRLVREKKSQNKIKLTLGLSVFFRQATS